MKTIDRYLWREMVVPFIIGTFVVTLMFQINELIAQYKQFNMAALPPIAIAQLILYKTPSYFALTLPVGMALASSLAISRLTRESELTAMRSAGVPILRVVAPVMAIGLLMAMVNFYVVDRVMPASEKAAYKLANEFNFAVAPEFLPDVMIKLGRYNASFGSVTRNRDGTVGLNDVFLFERPNPGEIWVYEAKQGLYKDGIWTFSEPYVRAIRNELLFLAKPGKDLVINEKIRVPDLFSTPRPEAQTLADLTEAIRLMRRQQRDTTIQEIAYWDKFSVPAACLIFALTGPLFAVWLSRSGPFVGVLLSLIMVMLYYNAYVISTKIFGPNRWLNPFMASWLPDILFFAMGLFALRRTE